MPKIVNLDHVTKENIKQHNSNWLEIADHPYRILIIGGSGSGKTNSLFNLISTNQILIKFVYMLKIHLKQYQLLINKCKSTGLKHFNDSKDFIENSNDIDDIYKNEEYNQNEK